VLSLVQRVGVTFACVLLVLPVAADDPHPTTTQLAVSPHVRTALEMIAFSFDRKPAVTEAANGRTLVEGYTDEVAAIVRMGNALEGEKQVSVDGLGSRRFVSLGARSDGEALYSALRVFLAKTERVDVLAVYCEPIYSSAGRGIVAVHATPEGVTVVSAIDAACRAYCKDSK
jgi:hypothetical protein